MATAHVKRGHRPDYFLIALIVMLTVAGLVILASASSNLGKDQFNDSYYYLKRQALMGILPGAIGFVLVLMVTCYQNYRKFIFPLLLLNIGLLALVFTKLGLAAGGARRWLLAGPISFQPSELLKITLVVYLAAWFTNPKMNRVKSAFEGLLPFLVILGIIGGLLLLEPATSMVVILLGTAFAMYFLSGAQWRHILLVLATGILILGAIIYMTPYRFERIVGFLNPTSDTQGINYQRTQAMIAVGSGGLWGVGYGQSTSKISSLPTPVGDSIFAVAAQELGFAGSATLVVLFAMLVFRLIYLSRKVRDRFGQLILVGFATIIGVQSFANIAAISGLTPLTGIPLPFISYGGTALAVSLIMSGIAANISKYT